MAEKYWPKDGPARCEHRMHVTIPETLQPLYEQCKRAAAAGSPYCWQHRPREES